MKLKLVCAAVIGLLSNVALAKSTPAANSQAAKVTLRSVEERIIPQMRGFSYIGPETDFERDVYRLKFLRGQKVVWIDVDAQTGEIIGRSGF